MSNRPFEDELRERFQQHQTPLDTNALWEQVEPRLPKKRKRRLFIWFWPLLGLALVAGLSWALWPEVTTEASSIQPATTTATAEPAAPAQPSDTPLLAESPELPQTGNTVRTTAEPALLPEVEKPLASTPLTPAKTSSLVFTPSRSSTSVARPGKEAEVPALESPLAKAEVNPANQADTVVTDRIQRAVSSVVISSEIAQSPEEATLAVVLEQPSISMPEEQVDDKLSPNTTTEPAVRSDDQLAIAKEATQQAKEDLKAERVKMAAAAQEAEQAKKAAAAQAAAAAKAARAAQKEATRLAAKQAKQAEQARKTAQKEAAAQAAKEAKAQRAAQKEAARVAALEAKQAEAARRAEAQAAIAAKREAARLAQLEAEEAERLKRSRDRLAAKSAKEAQQQARQATKGQGRMERIRARNIEQDRQLAIQRAERLATAQQRAQQSENKDNSQARTKDLAQTAKRLRKEAEEQRLAAQYEARSKAEAERRREKNSKLLAQRAKRTEKARKWLAKRANKTPEEEQKEFLNNLEKEARKKRLAYEKEEQERQRKVREITKRNKDQYAAADRNTRLAQARKRRARRLEQRLARQAEKLAERQERLAAREAKRKQRALAKGQKEPKPKKIRDKQSPFWTVEPGLALSLANRSVTAAGDATQAGINQEFEQPLEGISVQGLVGYHRPKGLSFRSGLVLSRINSRVQSETTTLGTTPVDATIAIVINPDGSQIEQNGSVAVASETTTTAKYYNSVSSFDIPLLLGYRFGGNKLGLMLEAGPTFNLSSGGSAHLFDGQSSYRQVGSDHFRTKLTSGGWLLNFGGAYQLSETTSLTANLRLQNFGSGGFEVPETAGYSTKYTLTGIQLGYRIRF